MEVPNDFKPFEIKDLDQDSILSDEVFEYLFSIVGEVQKNRGLAAIRQRASQLKMLSGFNSTYKAFLAEQVQKFKQDGTKTTHFTDSPIELNCGKWDCKDFGITKTELKNMMPVVEKACSHPILITKRYVNIDDRKEKVRVAFYKDLAWESVVLDRATISNNGAIVQQLSAYGVDVTSDSGRFLVQYFQTILEMNQKEIPLVKGVNHLGWVQDGFVPWVDNIEFDGESNFADLYDKIKMCGSYEQWKKYCVELRKNKVIRLVMAASFASPLLEKLGILPFIVHIWGTTGAGKTVALMVAASIWGNPELGDLVKQVNSTQYAMECTAVFLNNLPYLGNELQAIKNGDHFKGYDNLIMTLCEGMSKPKGKADGGLRAQGKWRNCFIFTGEEPITKAGSGGGAKNRVIEINCTDNIIEDGKTTSNFMRQNYGFAGREFVENIPSNLVEIYDEFYKKTLADNDTDSKQAYSMAAILTADKISSDLIFNDGYLEDISEFLKSKKEIDVVARAYDWTCSWIGINQNRFTNNPDFNRGEIWGEIKDGLYCLVSRDIYDDHLRKAGFDYNAIVKGMAEKNQIELSSQGKYSRQTSVNSIRGSYVKIMLDQSEETEINKDDILPY